MVVERGGLKYTVEVKGKWIGMTPSLSRQMRWIGLPGSPIGT